MGDVVSLRVSGLADAVRELERVTDRLTGVKVLRRVTVKALRPMRAAAKRRAGSRGKSGAMAAAMAITSRAGDAVKGLATNLQATGSTAVVGAVYTRNKAPRALALYNAYYRQEGKRTVKRLRHFHLVEFGTAKTRALWPLTRAYEETKAAVVPDVAALLRAELAKIR